MKGLPNVREGADLDDVLEEVVAARSTGQSPQELFGGPRDWLDAVAPSIGFYVGFLVGGLTWGIRAAIGVEVVVIAIRLIRRETLRHALSGALGVAVSVYFARRIGAKGFFLKDIIVNALYGTGFLLSALFRHPMVGVIMRLFQQDRPKEYHEHPTVRRAYTEMTLAWAALFFARLAVQGFFYANDWLGALAAAKIAMGYPLFLGTLAMTVPYVRWRTRDVPVPESAAEGDAEAGGEDAGDDAAEPVGGGAGA